MSKKKPEPPPITEREAASRGYIAGYRGEPRSSNPYNKSETLSAAWNSGWDRVPPEINAIVITQKSAKIVSDDNALTSI